MPTKRPRIAVTETDQLAGTLKLAAERWPEDRNNRGRLLLCVIEAGAKALEAQSDIRVTERRATIVRLSGALSGCFPEGYLAELRQDWPE